MIISPSSRCVSSFCFHPEPLPHSAAAISHTIVWSLSNGIWNHGNKYEVVSSLGSQPLKGKKERMEWSASKNQSPRRMPTHASHGGCMGWTLSCPGTRSWRRKIGTPQYSSTSGPFFAPLKLTPEVCWNLYLTNAIWLVHFPSKRFCAKLPNWETSKYSSPALMQHATHRIAPLKSSPVVN